MPPRHGACTIRKVTRKLALKRSTIHPLWVRLFHWLNAAAVIILCLSGWQVYNASPIFRAVTFPPAITLGGWLGGALLWHFAAMWILAGNLFAYLVLGIATGRLRRKLLPLGVRALLTDLAAALRGTLVHDDPARYNAVQKFAYLGALADIVLLVLSGLAIWKPVQFAVLRTLMGGFDNARIVHFVAMSVLVGFFVVHVVMVALVPRSLLTMIRGR
ncbi:cytochrome b/b6 domain-containing protein [Burkholderia seminalis]|nr:cytochrome b/b6 domain-containing protein [Burkholderia seminalis]